MTAITRKYRKYKKIMNLNKVLGIALKKAVTTSQFGS